MFNFVCLFIFISNKFVCSDSVKNLRIWLFPKIGCIIDHEVSQIIRKRILCQMRDRNKRTHSWICLNDLANWVLGYSIPYRNRHLLDNPIGPVVTCFFITIFLHLRNGDPPRASIRRNCHQGSFFTHHYSTGRYSPGRNLDCLNVASDPAKQILAVV